MKKTIILYGIALATITLLLKFIEFRFFIHDFSLEFYIGIIAFLFTVLGIWVGNKVTQRKKLSQESDNFTIN